MARLTQHQRFSLDIAQLDLPPAPIRPLTLLVFCSFVFLRLAVYISGDWWSRLSPSPRSGTTLIRGNADARAGRGTKYPRTQDQRYPRSGPSPLSPLRPMSSALQDARLSRCGWPPDTPPLSGPHGVRPGVIKLHAVLSGSGGHLSQQGLIGAVIFFA